MVTTAPIRWLAVLIVMGLSCSQALAQACVPAPPGVVAWWPFDETAPGLASDIGGSSPAAYFGAPSPATGRVGGGLRLNGSGDFVAAADNDLWAFGTRDFTIELWGKFSSPGGGTVSHPSHIFIGNDEGPGGRNKWFFALGGGFLNFHINSPSLGAQFFPLAPFSPVLDQWYHLAVVRSGNLYTILVNGTPVASATNSAAIPNAAAFLTIGQAENLGFMNGHLDEVTIYNRALTGEEIGQIAQSGGAGKCKPASRNLAVDSFLPSSGGNIGRTTVSISGSGFATGAVATLETASGPLAAIQSAVISPNSMRATFDLRGQAPRPATVRVANPDGSSVAAPTPFTISAGGGGRLRVDIIGPGTVRVGRDASFFLQISNTGQNDIRLANITAGFDWSGLPTQLTRPALPVGILPVPTGQPIMIPIQVPIPATVQGCGEFYASGESEEKPPEEMNCSELADRIKEVLAFIKETQDAIISVSDSYHRLECDGGGYLLHKELCDELLELLQNYRDILREANEYLAELLLERAAKRCPDDSSNFLGANNRSVELADAVNSSSGRSSQPVCGVNSWDPNDKIGTVGVGLARFTRKDNALNYKIFFENLPGASAPAQEVTITDRLDSNLDWTTATLRSIAWGTNKIAVPNGKRHFAFTKDLRPERDLLLRIEADINVVNGVVTWKFTSLDPATGKLPQDPLAGFLPPNFTPPFGEGSVEFLATPKANLLTGTVIRNSASIVFDANAPINTPEWSNALDNEKPESRIASLPPVVGTASFPLNWSGTDVGAGIKGYTIYVSENGSPFIPFLSDVTFTSATFNGLSGRTYAFYSVARDLVGNVEDAPQTAHATTTVAVPPPAVVLKGDLLVTPRPVPQGTSVTLLESIKNGGQAVVTGIPIRLAITDAANQVVAQWSDTPMIPVGGTFEFARSFSPVAAVGAVFNVVLTATINGVVTMLAQDSFTIADPPVKLNVAFEKPRQIRLLVLVSCGRDMRGRDDDHDHDTDNHGRRDDREEQWHRQNSRKCAVERASYLDAYFARLGFTRLVTTDDDEFKRAMRSGMHNVYWLAGGRKRLHDDLAAELREAVFRGESLIIDGIQDERNRELDPVLGVRFRGKLGGDNQRINVTGAVLPRGTLPTIGRALRLDLTTGQADAVFPASGNSPAIVLNQYGLGRSAFFGFDLVGTLMARPLETDDALFKAGFAWLLPPLPAISSPLEIMMLNTRVTNVGPTIDLKVRVSTSAGATVLSTAPAAAPDTNGHPVWSFNLLSAATKDFFAAVGLPNVSGNYMASATVESVRGGIVTTYGTFDIPLPVEGAEIVGPRVMAALKGLAISQKERRERDRALFNIQEALTKLAAAQYESAIEELLQATDKLMELTSVDVAPYRIQIGGILKEAQARWVKAQKSDGGK